MRPNSTRRQQSATLLQQTRMNQALCHCTNFIGTAMRYCHVLSRNTADIHTAFLNHYFSLSLFTQLTMIFGKELVVCRSSCEWISQNLSKWCLELILHQDFINIFFILNKKIKPVLWTIKIFALWLWCCTEINLCFFFFTMQVNFFIYLFTLPCINTNLGVKCA